MQRKMDKRTPAVVFTAVQTFVATCNQCPKVDGETARVDVSRKMAANMLRDIRKRNRKAV